MEGIKCIKKNGRDDIIMVWKRKYCMHMYMKSHGNSQSVYQININIYVTLLTFFAWFKCILSYFYMRIAYIGLNLTLQN